MACPGCLQGCDTSAFALLADQPVSTEIIIDGVFFKTLLVAKIGTMVPQHAHAVAHMTNIVKGAVRVWVNGALAGDYHAPNSVLIPAHDMHHFQTLLDDTRLVCIHDVSTDAVSVINVNQVPGISVCHLA